jgi:hypothetical protein
MDDGRMTKMSITAFLRRFSHTLRERANVQVNHWSSCLAIIALSLTHGLHGFDINVKRQLLMLERLYIHFLILQQGLA